MKRKNFKLTSLILAVTMLIMVLAGGCAKTEKTETDEPTETVSTADTVSEADTVTETVSTERPENAIETLSGIAISSDKISTETYKNKKYNNPISSEFYCADPTAVEYNGRLYLFGTNDHQQFETAGPDKDNSYEYIKSLVVMSTDDMVNWIYHGEINVGEVAPWITNSWAPSVVSRVEEDGLTHFYLYFSNNGIGVGVITSTDPVGPWSDPLGEPLISTSTPGLKNCPNPFDPGVVIDDNGDAWLSFGGGKAATGSDYMPGSSKIVKLGDDMLSFDSEFVDIPAPYFFEASELNYINGTFVYTYNCDWSDHSANWGYDCEAPTMCSMVYMTTETPLDSDSWVMKGEYFKNPGLSGFDYSNNHTHLHKYNGNYYIFYHNMLLKNGMGISGAYRSLGVDMINVDEETLTIEAMGGTKDGTESVNNVDPFASNLAAELNNTAEITFDTSNMAEPVVVSDKEGSWISVRDVFFTESDDSEDTTAAVTEELTAVNTIQYNFTVKSVDKKTVLSMYPSAKGGADCQGSVEIAENGKYSVTCEIGGADMMQNLGYFAVDNDAQITLMLETIVVNGEYEFDINSELTNTRDWANGLKNIWSGLADGDEVYVCDNAVFKYIASDGAIELFALTAGEGSAVNAKPVEFPMTFFGQVKGTGRIEVHLDSTNGDLLTAIDFDTPDEFAYIYSNDVAEVGGTRDLYFVFSDGNIEFKAWQFAERAVTQ